MFEIREIHDKDLKTSITLEIMHALPDWFSPPEDIDRKSVIHRDMPFFAAFDGDKAIGFIALKIHNKYTMDMFNLGVLQEYHRQGVGHAMLEAVEDYGRKNGFKFITVKTLDASAQYEPYERTRAFYFKNGFYPLEVFPLFWNEENPCLFLAKYIG
ncbi:MAG: GNAT family N-acetyltransferase [Clostridiaceae bacterium]|jgi:GNAT superfamily N-acetyltransferase|nr:GNAT family N-acetyltransferase [Bacillota bacterium]NLI39372.1 GNAT family N-acetyltransferase [Clostridiaceae bacterium]